VCLTFIVQDNDDGKEIVLVDDEATEGLQKEEEALLLTRIRRMVMLRQEEKRWQLDRICGITSPKSFWKVF
jgi:hypothetical protein